MPDKTNLEIQEEKLSPVFGGAKAIGSKDNSMLEMSDTNKLVIDPRQSELLLAWDMLYKAVTAYANRYPEKRWQRDPVTGRSFEKAVLSDSWAWVKDLAYQVKANQLTHGGYSRLQHLELNAPALPINEDLGDQGGLFSGLGRLFGSRQ